MNSFNFGEITTPRSGVKSSPFPSNRMRVPGMPRLQAQKRGRGLGVPSLGGLQLMKFATGGIVDPEGPSMGSLMTENTMRGRPGMSIFEYLSERMADGGVPDEQIYQMRRRHGAGRYRGSLDINRHGTRTMLENDPMSWWDRGYEDSRREYDASIASSRGQPGIYMEPELGNEFTQNAIDNVQGPSFGRQVLEFLLGDSPSTAVMSAQLKGFAPSPRIGGLAALLSSSDAGASSDEMIPRDFEGYGRWQPFNRVRGRIR